MNLHEHVLNLLASLQRCISELAFLLFSNLALQPVSGHGLAAPVQQVDGAGVQAAVVVPAEAVLER
jgi:hypothetical protein